MPRRPQAAATASGRKRGKSTTALAFLAVPDCGTRRGALDGRAGHSPRREPRCRRALHGHAHHRGRRHVSPSGATAGARSASSPAPTARSPTRRSPRSAPTSTSIPPRRRAVARGEAPRSRALPRRGARQAALRRRPQRALPVARRLPARPRGRPPSRARPASPPRRRRSRSALARRRRLRGRQGPSRAFLALADSRPRRRRRFAALSGGATRVDLDGRVQRPSTPGARPDPRARGLGGRLRRHGQRRSPCSTPATTRPTPTWPGRSPTTANFTPRPSAPRPQRPRHPRRLDHRRHRRRLGGSVPRRRAGRRPADRQGARRRRLGQDSRIIAGMEWAAAQRRRRRQHEPRRPTPTDGTDPLSHAVDGSRRADRHALRHRRRQQRRHPSTIDGPGAADAALTVGAVDRDDTLADFSSRGPRLGDAAVKPEITAPGRRHRRRAGRRHRRSATRSTSTTRRSTAPRWPPRTWRAPPRSSRSGTPTWTASASRPPLAGAAAAVDGATAFDAGTGRVDAERAIAAPRCSRAHRSTSASIRTRSRGPPVTHTPVTYTNPGEEPLELEALARLAARALASRPPASPLSATQLAVPAGGTRAGRRRLSIRAPSARPGPVLGRGSPPETASPARPCAPPSASSSRASTTT